MDNKSLELLEFPRIREMLAGFTSFSVSAEVARAIVPLADREAIVARLAESAEARRLLEEESDVAMGGVTDVRESARLARLGKVLEPLMLLDIQQTLAATRQVRRKLSPLATEYPRLWQIASGIAEMADLEKDIIRCIGPGGEVLDSASPELAGIRQRLKRTREHLLQRLEATVKSARGRRIVQEPIVTEREGRYVIPIKAEARKEMRGIVHDVSNTGATLFIEPFATLDMGNELRQLLGEEKNEVERILRDLSIRVAAHEDDIARSIELTAALDLILAKARFAEKARAVEPAITDFTPGVLKLEKARHPLLGEKAVPLSVEIGRDYSILVVTGPNMGGKTVALKTIGLLSAMALAGLPIPASSESTVPLLDGIFADIGDEQSIEQTVSTFGWHVGNIVRIVNSATDRSLVLLDELGTSTDPAEGSALARSVLLYLLSCHTTAIATTHFDDLKAFAHTTPGLRNASLDLDPVTHMPTYHLTVGVPGGSNALAIAAQLGLPEKIIAGARDMLSRGSQELESLLADLSSERQKLAALRGQVGQEKEALDKRAAAVSDQAKALRAEERKLVRETKDRLVLEAADLQREIRQAVAELRKQKTRDGIEKARQALAAVQDRLKKEVWQAPEPEQPVREDGAIRVGDTVLLKDTSVRATVLALLPSSGQAEVQAGHARLTIRLAGLEKISPATNRPILAAVTSTFTPPASRQLDLRGKRADEIEPALDRYLNDASLAGLSEVRIIHGMGTGTVRQIVREMLAAHPLVKSYRLAERGEGGDGATVVKL